MSFSDLFRGFFGFPGHGRPRAPLFGSTARDEDEDEEDVSSSTARPPHDFAFGFSPGGSRGAFEELFRDVGELLGVFGGAWAGPPLPFEPSLPGPGPGQALRDSMLKQPDSQASPAGPESASDPARAWSPLLGVEDADPAPPGLKADQDLDSQVSSSGLGTILRPEQPQPHSYFQSVSVTKVTLPDGSMQECRTVQDSLGRCETTLTRRRGAQGQQQEELSMDDRELAQFAEEFQAPNLSFFRRWFSSW